MLSTIFWTHKMPELSDHVFPILSSFLCLPENCTKEIELCHSHVKHFVNLHINFLLKSNLYVVLQPRKKSKPVLYVCSHLTLIWHGHSPYGIPTKETIFGGKWRVLSLMALPPQFSAGGNSPPLGRGTILTCDPELVVYLHILTVLYIIYIPLYIYNFYQVQKCPLCCQLSQSTQW